MRTKSLITIVLSVLMILVFTPTIVSAESIETTGSTSFLTKYDLNNDQIVNGLDLALMKQKVIEGNCTLCELVSLKRFLLDVDVTTNTTIDVSDYTTENLEIISNISNDPVKIDMEKSELIFEHETLQFAGLMNIGTNLEIFQGKCTDSDKSIVQTYKVFAFNEKLYIDVTALPQLTAEAIFLDELEVSETNTQKLLNVFSSNYTGAINSSAGELTLTFVGLGAKINVIAMAEPDVPDSATEIYRLQINPNSRVVIVLYQSDNSYLLEYRM